MKKAILVLEDGRIFRGTAFGVIGYRVGEICFTTAMTGYQEIFTDPSFFGQIVVSTTSHLGNYGIHQQENESNKPKIRGFICQNISSNTSRSTSQSNIEEYFIKHQLIGIYDIDTRSLVQHIRKKGSMKAIILSEEEPLNTVLNKLKQSPDICQQSLVAQVSTATFHERGNIKSTNRIAILDLGIKSSIIKELEKRNSLIGLFPHDSKAEKILDWNPTGIILSNGPGDPNLLTTIILTIKELVVSGIPILGICLGHQLLCLGQGLRVEKMHIGHRGINHPVKDLNSGNCYITTQNHGYAVSNKNLPNHSTIRVSHIHLNDQSIAGIEFIDKPIISVQFHPEGGPGPKDASYLFDFLIQ